MASSKEQAATISNALTANQETCDGTGSAKIGKSMGAGFGQGQGMGQRNGGGFGGGMGRGASANN